MGKRKNRSADGKRQIGPMIDGELYIKIKVYCVQHKEGLQDFVERALRKEYECVTAEQPETDAL